MMRSPENGRSREGAAFLHKDSSNLPHPVRTPGMEATLSLINGLTNPPPPSSSWCCSQVCYYPPPPPPNRHRHHPVCLRSTFPSVSGKKWIASTAVCRQWTDGHQIK
ncbi:hypothetical protein CgunFtcFv8_024594 [Champsocephalus gunnari]|uniref:Uncharacterized protein n=1 Tax=Champsocephalus gunnari TaxID=52237 RepID=A0AAN8DD64_CHAGU|nr:hypothetical protein CgunFtcFv8_024594 [Champsocephalus gunnari]